jgi:hypothetical protein
MSPKPSRSIVVASAACVLVASFAFALVVFGRLRTRSADLVATADRFAAAVVAGDDATAMTFVARDAGRMYAWRARQERVHFAGRDLRSLRVVDVFPPLTLRTRLRAAITGRRPTQTVDYDLAFDDGVLTAFQVRLRDDGAAGYRVVSFRVTAR